MKEENIEKFFLFLAIFIISFLMGIIIYLLIIEDLNIESKFLNCDIKYYDITYDLIEDYNLDCNDLKEIKNNNWDDDKFIRNRQFSVCNGIKKENRTYYYSYNDLSLYYYERCLK